MWSVEHSAWHMGKVQRVIDENTVHLCWLFKALTPLSHLVHSIFCDLTPIHLFIHLFTNLFMCIKPCYKIHVKWLLSVFYEDSSSQFLLNRCNYVKKNSCKNVCRPCAWPLLRAPALGCSHILLVSKALRTETKCTEPWGTARHKNITKASLQSSQPSRIREPARESSSSEEIELGPCSQRRYWVALLQANQNHPSLWALPPPSALRTPERVVPQRHHPWNYLPNQGSWGWGATPWNCQGIWEETHVTSSDTCSCMGSRKREEKLLIEGNTGPTWTAWGLRHRPPWAQGQIGASPSSIIPAFKVSS